MPLYSRPDRKDSMSFHSPRVRRSMLVIGAVLLALLTASTVFENKGGNNGNGGKKEAKSSQSSHPSAKQDKSAKSEKHAKAKAWHDNRGWEQGHKWRGRGSWQANRSNDWAHDHAGWAKRGGYHGYLIGAPVFSQNFGRGNPFVITSRPVMYQGYSRFNRNGQSFVMVDPYPGSWSNDWYARDEVYVAYDNGYYLHNRKHPGYPMAVMVLE
jgi:hypothetical protein